MARLMFTLFIALFTSIDAYSTYSTSLSARSVTPTPYRQMYVLANNQVQYISFWDGDNPPCPNSSFWVNSHCTTGYTPYVFGYLSHAGGWDGGDTGHDINGLYLRGIWISQDTGWSYQISTCAATFYDSGEGNANRAWVGYTVLCVS